MPEQGTMLLSPLGVMTLMSAALIDVAGWILLCFGLDDFWILDLAGVLIVGPLVLMCFLIKKKSLEGAGEAAKEVAMKATERTRKKVAEKAEKKAAEKLTEKIGEKATKKLSGQLVKKLGLSLGSELIPYWGAICPSWIIGVYSFLKDL